LILREDEIIGIAGDVAGLPCDPFSRLSAAAAGVETRKFFLRDFFVSDKANIRGQKLKTSEPSINATRT
jgi:hypothetical protein